MSRINRSAAVAVLAGTLMVGSLGYAMADDAGGGAFFDLGGPGSARGAGNSATTEQAPDTAAQPDTGVAQPSAVRRRPTRARAAALHVGRVSHVAANHRVLRHPAVVAEHGAAPHGPLHAMHRMREGEGNQS